MLAHVSPAPRKYGPIADGGTSPGPWLAAPHARIIVAEVGRGPAGAPSDGLDRLGAKGFAEVMVDQQHPPPVRVLVAMVRAPAVAWATPVALDRALPVLRVEVS
jgi:hypothetical protein